MLTMTEKLTMAVRPGVSLRAEPEGLVIDAPGWSQTLPVTEAGVSASLAGLTTDRSAEEIARDAVVASGSFGAAMTVQVVLARLQSLGVLEHRVVADGNLRAWLRTAGAMPCAVSRMPDDGQVRTLSPLLIATLADGFVQLESGATHLKVGLTPELFGRLVEEGHGSLPGPVADLLFSAGLLLTPDEAADRRVRQWDPSDAWFHRRVSESRGNDGYGGTYHLAAEFDPLPYDRPAPGASIALPVPDESEPKGAPVIDAIEKRRSFRSFQAGKTTLAQLSQVLYRTVRARQTFPDDHGLDVVDRPYPSGGSIHELDTYLVINDVAGLDPGIYRYAPLRHELDLISADPLARTRLSADAQIPLRAEVPAPIVMIISARFGRLMWKYQGMPYALLTKHVGVLYQTTYLAGEAAGLGVCGIGGTSSTLFAQVTGEHPLDEGPVGMMVLGVADRTEADPWGRP